MDEYLATDQRPTQTSSGLTLMGARVYNPYTGNFTTTDRNVLSYRLNPDPLSLQLCIGNDARTVSIHATRLALCLTEC